MTLSDERLREQAEHVLLGVASGKPDVSDAAKVLAEMVLTSPHGEAGEQDAEPEYDRPDHHAIDGSGDVQPFSPTPSVETGRVTDTMVAALANSLFRDIGTVSDDAARRALEAALSASPGSSAEPVAKDWLDDFDGDKPIYTDRELIDLLGALLQAQVREQRINSIEELHGMLRHIGRSQRAHRAHRALTGADSNA